MQSRTIVERRVPERDRRRNTRALSMEKAAPTESNRKVPQTPRRQPATNPAVKPPITPPWKENLRSRIRYFNRKASHDSGSGESEASAKTFCKNVHSLRWR